jgi:prepilin-type N-terminal cleavage/methylation domain-containing protein
MIARGSNLLARRAFTLIEVVMSLLVLAILLAAVEASLVASTKAIPDPKSFTGAIRTGATAINRVASELVCAMSVTEMSAKAITFTVPDRNGDGTPETIRYAWSGVAGDPLTRTYNGGAAGNLTPSIQDFRLLYDKTSQPYYTTSEGAEVLVYSFTNTLLGQNVPISSISWPGQYVIPSFSNDVISWRVSRVKLRVHDNGSPDGTALVQLRTATPGGIPTNRVLDQATLVEKNLGSSYAWAEFGFSGHSNLNPNNGVCIVIPMTGSASDCGMVQKNTLSLLGAAKFIKSTDGGLSWTSSGLDNLLIYVYGVPTRQDPVAYNYFLSNVTVSVCTSSNAKAALTTTVKLLNTPQVAGP